MGRLTRWEGRDEDGPRAVLARRDNFNQAMQEALRKLARYEDMEENDVTVCQEIYQADGQGKEDHRDDHS